MAFRVWNETRVPFKDPSTRKGPHKDKHCSEGGGAAFVGDKLFLRGAVQTENRNLGRSEMAIQDCLTLGDL